MRHRHSGGQGAAPLILQSDVLGSETNTDRIRGTVRDSQYKTLRQTKAKEGTKSGGERKVSKTLVVKSWHHQSPQEFWHWPQWNRDHPKFVTVSELYPHFWGFTYRTVSSKSGSGPSLSTVRHRFGVTQGKKKVFFSTRTYSWMKKE